MKIKKHINQLLHFRYLENVIWLSGLLFLYFINAGPGHFSVCILKLSGLEFCPGCGLGTSIHHAMHFEFQQSWNEHMLGIPVLGILLYKIFKPFFPPTKQIKLT